MLGREQPGKGRQLIEGNSITNKIGNNYMRTQLAQPA